MAKMLNGTDGQSNPPQNGHAPIGFNGHAHPVGSPNRPGPHNLEAEQAFFGAAFNDNSVLEQVPFLEPQHFYDALNQRIFEVMATLFRSGKDVSAITLKPFFENCKPISSNMTVPQYLVRLYANATTIINAEDYAHTIRELADRRSAIVIGEDLVLKLISRLLGHELHSQGNAKAISLSRESVIEVQTTLDLFIEEASRQNMGINSPSGSIESTTRMVGSKN